MKASPDDYPYAAPKAKANKPGRARQGVPPPYTGAKNLSLWLTLLPIFLGMVVAAAQSLSRWWFTRP